MRLISTFLDSKYPHLSSSVLAANQPAKMKMEKAAQASRGFFDGMQSSSSSPNKQPAWLSSLAKPGGTIRNHFVALCGEFLGTFLFLFFAFTGTQVANSQTQGSSTTIAQGSNPAQLLYISLCFGFSLAVNAWVFFRISGGLFNPAVYISHFCLSHCLFSLLRFLAFLYPPFLLPYSRTIGIAMLTFLQ